jgi:hypothetical protein
MSRTTVLDVVPIPHELGLASAVTGAKRLTRLPSGSRNNTERLPHGIVVGALTNSVVNCLNRSYSASTSSTRNSMIAVWSSAARAERPAR